LTLDPELNLGLEPSRPGQKLTKCIARSEANAHPSQSIRPTKATKLAEAHKRLWRWSYMCCSQWTSTKCHQVNWGTGRGNRTGLKACQCWEEGAGD